MGAEADLDEELERAPQLAPGRDPTALSLTPAEGFLLSRIDGSTSWRLLREIGGLTSAEVDRCLRSWSAEGVVVWAESGSGAPTPAAAESGVGIDLDVDESLLDPELALDLGVQRRILAFEDGLGRSYHELLGVDVSADAREIKRCYFRLSKEFHPDRYFRKKVGHYGSRLERIFKKILEAYELLSDPVARSEIEKTMDCAPPREPPPQRPAEAARAAPPSSPVSSASAAARRKALRARPLSKRERLQRRMRIRIPESVLAERRQKASLLGESARVAHATGKLREAAASIRLAIAFDPARAEYKESFAQIQAALAEARVTEILERGDVEPSERREALRLCEETLLYRPHDPELNFRAARLALEMDQYAKAGEYAQCSIDHSPEVARYHRVRGQVHQALGEKGHAINAFEQALALDANDEEARRLLALFGRSPARRGMQGGMR